MVGLGFGKISGQLISLLSFVGDNNGKTTL